MSNVVPFVPSHGGKTYRPEFVLFEGGRRRQWVVVECEADGTETCIGVYRGRKSEAFSMANFYTKAEAHRRRDLEMLARDPLGQEVLDMTPDHRDLMIKLLNAAQRMTGNAS